MKQFLISVSFLFLSLLVRSQDLRFTYADPDYFQDKSMPDIKQLIDRGREIEYEYPDSAFKIYQKAYAHSRARKYTYGAGMALMHMAYVMPGSNDRKSLLPVYQKALTYALQTEDYSNLIVLLYLKIASIYNHYGNHKTAADYVYRALHLTVQSSTENQWVALYVYNA